MRFLLCFLVACGGGTTSSPPPSTPQPEPAPLTTVAAPAAPPPASPSEGCWTRTTSSETTMCMIDQLDGFSQRMCACTDKPCADAVNQELTKWGTDMAQNINPKADDGKPDPALVARSQNIMTRYTDCMTKAMTAQP